VKKLSSQYRGVSCWQKKDNKWEVKIRYDGKQHNLGLFEDEEAAARAYDRAARAQHGERAKLNFPTKKEQAAEEAKQQRWIKCAEAGSMHKYRGVSWYKRDNKWSADITYDGKLHHLGSFEDEEEAARGYDRAARAHKGEKAQLNFPAEGERGCKQPPKYRGVRWNKINKKWVVIITYSGKQHYLGCFEAEEDAARAYDRAARAHKGEKAQLNFPQSNFPAEGESGSKNSSKYSSKYRGVCWYKRNSHWEANIQHDGKQHSLGRFEDEEEAARAYDRAARAHKGEKARLNFPAEGERGPWQSSKLN
jgi:hypothetical protein